MVPNMVMLAINLITYSNAVFKNPGYVIINDKLRDEFKMHDQLDKEKEKDKENEINNFRSSYLTDGLNNDNLMNIDIKKEPNQDIYNLVNKDNDSVDNNLVDNIVDLNH